MRYCRKVHNFISPEKNSSQNACYSLKEKSAGTLFKTAQLKFNINVCNMLPFFRIFMFFACFIKGIYIYL